MENALAESANSQQEDFGVTVALRESPEFEMYFVVLIVQNVPFQICNVLNYFENSRSNSSQWVAAHLGACK